MRYPKHQMRYHDGDRIPDNWLRKHQVVIHVGGQPTQCENNDNGDHHFDGPLSCDFNRASVKTDCISRRLVKPYSLRNEAVNHCNYQQWKSIQKDKSDHMEYLQGEKCFFQVRLYPMATPGNNNIVHHPGKLGRAASLAPW